MGDSWSPSDAALFAPTPATQAHLLTLPPVIQPLSADLATLHLARIRLALAISSSTLRNTGWCPICGRLGARPTRLSRLKAQFMARVNSILESTVAPNQSTSIEINQPQQQSSESTQLGESESGGSGGGISGIGNGSGIGIGPERTGKPHKGKDRTKYGGAGYESRLTRGACDQCGAGPNTKLPSPSLASKADFPSARSVRSSGRRRVLLGAMALSGKENQVEGSGFGSGSKVVQAPSPAGVGLVRSEAMILDTPTLELEAQRTGPGAGRGPRLGFHLESVKWAKSGVLAMAGQDQGLGQGRMRIMASPPLKHVYTSSPNLPTYPAPTSPLHAQGKGLTSPAMGKKAKGTGNGKRKRSGLAKLLAENKDREGSIGSGGSWGLD